MLQRTYSILNNESTAFTSAAAQASTARLAPKQGEHRKPLIVLRRECRNRV